VKRILVLVPMPLELKPFRKLEPSLQGKFEITSVLTGMGTERAAAAAEQGLADVKPDHVIVSGIAGGVSPQRIGDLVIPEVAVNGTTGEEYRAAPLGDARLRGRLSTGDALTPVAGDNELAAQGILAVDMETASFAAVAQRHGVPWTAFRGVSDLVSDGFLTEETFKLANMDGTPNYGEAAKFIARRPWWLPRLIRFGRGGILGAKVAAAAAISALATDG
jgi:nucleoside phosphorylase